ncbi:MAG: hypothetical protein ABJQ29_08710 [Luteolibacter sp.]
MSEKSTGEYTGKMRARYGCMTGRKARDKFIEITGWERKHRKGIAWGRMGTHGDGPFAEKLLERFGV